jgi:hypothetical protein
MKQGGFLMAGRDRSPLLQPRPEPFDLVAVGVNPVWAGDGCLGVPGWNGRSSAPLPDVLAEGMAAEASISHHPLWDTKQPIEERDGMREFMSLPGSQNEGHRPSEPVGDHTGFGPHSPDESAQAPHAGPAALETPFSSGTGCFLMRLDAGAVQEGHPEVNAPLLHQQQQALPNT